MWIRPLVAAPGMQETDMSVFTDSRLMDGHDDTAPTDFFSIPLHAAAAEALSYRVGSDGHWGQASRNDCCTSTCSW